MSESKVVKPAEGERIMRMSNTPLVDAGGNQLPNTKGNVVNFKVEHGKEFAGAKKYLKDGDVLENIHILHAEGLQAKGIGKIVK